MFDHTIHYSLLNILSTNQPLAQAIIAGNDQYPNLNGTVKFYVIPYRGVIVEAEIYSLPDSMEGNANAFFGFHIHENGDCSNSFQNTGSHYNPHATAHPFHAGDMPPLMSTGGFAWTAFFDARISIPEIINKSVVIHRMPDDFTTQPAGDSGEKIACGVIEAVKR